MLKKLAVAFVFLMVHHLANAQLTIYQDLQKGGSSQVCSANGLYVGTNIPGGLNNNIKSIVLTQGYMATLANNEDGTGESFCYVAATGNIDLDLAGVLQNKVSFIRVLPIGVIKKKGVCGKDNDVVAALKPAWFYDWGTSDVSTNDIQYVPLTFGLNAATDLTRVATYTAKTDVNSLSGFNEPNSTSQGNIPNPATAVPAYKNLLRTGYRMGSPATTEEQYNNWLATFIAGANADTIRVDYIAIHWYDWGNWSSGGNASPNAADVLTRFKAYINNVYTLYKRPIWITEFNANPNRTTATQEAFMTLALAYLETESRVERYAFFFPNSSPASNSGTFSALTTLGQIYSDHTSTNSFTSNISDTRSTTPISSSTNNVFNGDFETTSATNPIFPGWSFSAPADFVKETANAITTTSVRFASATNDRYMTSDAISVTPGTTYRLRFTCRIQSAAGAEGGAGPSRGGVFSADILNGSNLASTTFTTITSTLPNNTILDGNYTVPTGQTSIKLRFRKTADIAYLDDVSLIDASTLPIKLISFNGKADNDGISLNWQTGSEVNNEKFTLYRSTNGKDFSPIAVIKGAGNSSELHNYSYFDKYPTNGVNYYQLRQTDFDGRSETFSPVAVNFKLENQDIKIYSDLNSTQIGLNWRLDETVNVNIFDFSGRRIFNDKVHLQGGKNLINLDTSLKLAAHHLYIFTISGVGNHIALKFLSNF